MQVLKVAEHRLNESLQLLVRTVDVEHGSEEPVCCQRKHSVNLVCSSFLLVPRLDHPEAVSRSSICFFLDDAEPKLPEHGPLLAREEVLVREGQPERLVPRGQQPGYESQC